MKYHEEQFIRNLKDKGFEVWDEEGFIEVKISNDTEKAIFSSAYDSGAEIRYFGSRSSTLEDVFVDLFLNKEGIH